LAGSDFERPVWIEVSGPFAGDAHPPRLVTILLTR
jgi:hypothetical protein